MNEYIYIARNPSFPDLIKIGYTERDPMDRINDLSRPSGIPTKFELVHACIVKNGREVERCIHFVFGDYRHRDDREFFKVNPEKVIAMLSQIQIEDVTPSNNEYIEDKEDRESIDRVNTRRSNFSFKSAEIPIGSIITFTRDESIIAEVVGDKKIKIRGKETSLTAAAKKLLRRETKVRGPDFWIFENQTLTDRRNLVESGKFSKTVEIEESASNDERSPPLRFSKIGIPFGSTIVFSENRRIKAKVINDRQISFRGKLTSLSRAATILLNRNKTRGPNHWMFKGETLTERRNRYENENYSEFVNPEKSTNNDGRKSPLRFSRIGIPDGSTLFFSEDRRFRAVVINDRQISFRRQTTSLSGAAQILLGRRSARGPDYWTYEGETLTERRKRFEKGG